MTLEWLGGSMVALVTPFKEDRLDEDAFASLIDRQIDGGTSALVIAGTTGESAALTEEEHVDVVAKAVKLAAGRIPVIAGVGANVTRDAVALAKKTQDAGADALMATTGYYNKPSVTGLLRHYELLGEATPLPVIVYNVPSRTASDLSEELVAELAMLPTMAALKDASGDLARMARHRINCPKEFVFLSGEDITAVGFNAMGGAGCISVSANVAPKLCAEMQAACAAGDYTKAVEIQDKLTPLHDAMFSDASPAPAKYALSKLGLCEESLRLPLVPANEKARALVDEALASLDL